MTIRRTKESRYAWVELGELIRHSRERMGLSLDGLIDLIEEKFGPDLMIKGTLSNIERGAVEPKAMSLYWLAKLGYIPLLSL